MRDAPLLKAQLRKKITSERARVCPNVTRAMIDEMGNSSPQGPLRDELRLWRKLDEFRHALSEMIDGDDFSAFSFLADDVGEYDRFENRVKDSLHEFLSGSWRPNYRKWLAAARADEKAAIEAKIDDEARAYQACWEKKHGRPWPTPLDWRKRRRF
jgi:hypothetical protein